MTALEARCARLPFVQTDWTAAARARLTAVGLPQKRDEYWRYSDPSALTAPVPASVAAAAVARVFAAVDALKIVFVDGVYAPEKSDDLCLSGVEITHLSAVQKGDHWAQEIYGALEARGQNPVARPLAALNTAYASQGVLIRVTRQAARPVALVYETTRADADVLLHHVVQLAEDASLTLLEEGHIGARAVTVLEADLGADAQLHHLRIQAPDHKSTQNTHVFAQIGQDALFKSFTLNAHGGMVRNDAVVWLVGKGGAVHLSGAALTRGAHHDDTVFITHQAEGCESRQVFKKVLDHDGVSVFQGKIYVHPEAQKTDGYQISQALLLDDGSQFLAKPELEIYADDVKCSHGSTSGAVDETAMFYLQSRGVPQVQARALLVLAFLAEVLGEIADEALSAAVYAHIERWLADDQLS